MNDPDKLSDKEKITMGLETLKEFWDLFGDENDIYKQVFLEEVMKFLLKNPDVS